MANPHVSSTIGGATSVRQVEENLKAVEVIDKLTPEVMKEIDAILDNTPKVPTPTAMSNNYRLKDLRHFL